MRHCAEERSTSGRQQCRASVAKLSASLPRAHVESNSATSGYVEAPCRSQSNNQTSAQQSSFKLNSIPPIKQDTSLLSIQHFNSSGSSNLHASVNNRKAVGCGVYPTAAPSLSTAMDTSGLCKRMGAAQSLPRLDSLDSPPAASVSKEDLDRRVVVTRGMVGSRVESDVGGKCGARASPPNPRDNPRGAVASEHGKDPSPPCAVLTPLPSLSSEGGTDRVDFIDRFGQPQSHLRAYYKYSAASPAPLFQVGDVRLAEVLRSFPISVSECLSEKSSAVVSASVGSNPPSGSLSSKTASANALPLCISVDEGVDPDTQSGTGMSLRRERGAHTASEELRDVRSSGQCIAVDEARRRSPEPRTNENVGCSCSAGCGSACRQGSLTPRDFLNSAEEPPKISLTSKLASSAETLFTTTSILKDSAIVSPRKLSCTAVALATIPALATFAPSAENQQPLALSVSRPTNRDEMKVLHSKIREWSLAELRARKALWVAFLSDRFNLYVTKVGTAMGHEEISSPMGWAFSFEDVCAQIDRMMQCYFDLSLEASLVWMTDTYLSVYVPGCAIYRRHPTASFVPCGGNDPSAEDRPLPVERRRFMSILTPPSSSPKTLNRKMQSNAALTCTPSLHSFGLEPLGLMDTPRKQSQTRVPKSLLVSESTSFTAELLLSIDLLILEDLATASHRFEPSCAVTAIQTLYTNSFDGASNVAPRSHPASLASSTLNSTSCATLLPPPPTPSVCATLRASNDITSPPFIINPHEVVLTGLLREWNAAVTGESVKISTPGPAASDTAGTTDPQARKMNRPLQRAAKLTPYELSLPILTAIFAFMQDEAVIHTTKDSGAPVCLFYPLPGLSFRRVASIARLVIFLREFHAQLQAAATSLFGVHDRLLRCRLTQQTKDPSERRRQKIVKQCAQEAIHFYTAIHEIVIQLYKWWLQFSHTVFYSTAPTWEPSSTALVGANFSGLKVLQRPELLPQRRTDVCQPTSAGKPWRLHRRSYLSPVVVGDGFSGVVPLVRLIKSSPLGSSSNTTPVGLVDNGQSRNTDELSLSFSFREVLPEPLPTSDEAEAFSKGVAPDIPLKGTNEKELSFIS